MVTSFYCAWNIPRDHLHGQPWAKFIIWAAHWHQWCYLYIKDIHTVVGLILAFLRRARPRADCYKRRLKDSKEESFSNQKEVVVFCVGSSWEPGDGNGELLLQLVREVFYLLRNSLRRMVATESLMWTHKGELRTKKEEKRRGYAQHPGPKEFDVQSPYGHMKTALYGEKPFFFHLHVFLQLWFLVGGGFFLGCFLCLVIIPLMALLISLRYGQADKFQVPLQLLSAEHTTY